jgi:formylglycine-generating enzyme required for sulfatase activity
MGTTEQEAQNLKGPDLPEWVKKELPSEQPQHEVRLTHGYWIDQYEVTNAAFQAFIDAGGYTARDYWSEPVGRVKWQTRKGCFIRNQRRADQPWSGSPV